MRASERKDLKITIGKVEVGPEESSTTKEKESLS